VAFNPDVMMMATSIKRMYTTDSLISEMAWQQVAAAPRDAVNAG
jgi:hypothetical protein